MTQYTTQHPHGTADVTQEHSILNEIHEGMTVYDANRDNIGEVEFVHFGAASATQRAHGTGPATITSADTGYDRPFAGMIASIFNPGEIPDELAERLYRTGFVRIDSAGLFAADRYVTPDQISRVDQDGVYLNVDRDGLLRRS